MIQLHDSKVWEPNSSSRDMRDKERKRAMESLVFLTAKKMEQLKLEDAKQNHDIMTLDVPNALYTTEWRKDCDEDSWCIS